MSSLTQSKSTELTKELAALIEGYERAGGIPEEAARLRMAAAFALRFARDGKRTTPTEVLLLVDEFDRQVAVEVESLRKARTWWNAEPGHA